MKKKILSLLIAFTVATASFAPVYGGEFSDDISGEPVMEAQENDPELPEAEAPLLDTEELTDLSDLTIDRPEGNIPEEPEEAVPEEPGNGSAEETEEQTEFEESGDLLFSDGASGEEKPEGQSEEVPAPKEIEILKQPDLTSYYFPFEAVYFGEEKTDGFNYGGLTFRVQYSDGSSKELTVDASEMYRVVDEYGNIFTCRIVSGGAAGGPKGQSAPAGEYQAKIFCGDWESNAAISMKVLSDETMPVIRTGMNIRNIKNKTYDAVKFIPEKSGKYLFYKSDASQTSGNGQEKKSLAVYDAEYQELAAVNGEVKPVALTEGAVYYVVNTEPGAVDSQTYYAETMEPVALTKCTVSMASAVYYTGQKQQPVVKITGPDGEVLTKDEDYTATYSNNLEPGTASVQISGKEDYTGTLEKTFTIRMGTPKLISAVSASYNSIKITWGEVTGATGYCLYQKINGLWYYMGRLSATSYTHVNRANFPVQTGVANTYTVRAYRTVAGKNIMGGFVTAGITGMAVPDKPVLKAAASAGYDAVNISWNAVPGAKTYNIYYKTADSVWKLAASRITGTSYTHTSNSRAPLVTGTQYTYTVRAISGNAISGFDAAGKKVTPLPATVKLGKVTSAAYNKVKITWNAVPGATGYCLYQKLNGKWYYMGRLSATSYVHTDRANFPVKTGVVNTYTVRAYRTVGGKNFMGGFVAAGVSGKAVPDLPKLVSAKSSGNQVTITWNKAAGSTAYAIYRKENGRWVKLAAVAGMNTVSYTHTSTAQHPIVPGTQYTYTVRSYTSTGKTYGLYDPNGISVTASVQGYAVDILNQVGWDLRAAFNWSAALPYYTMSSATPAGMDKADYFALYGFQNRRGNCYVMASVFYQMAKVLGYDAHFVMGSVPLAAGGMGGHGWVEINMNGGTYVFDPDFTHETGRNGYMITYGTSGTWRYSNYYRVN